jgi:hypothetical protein
LIRATAGGDTSADGVIKKLSIFFFAFLPQFGTANEPQVVRLAQPQGM